MIISCGDRKMSRLTDSLVSGKLAKIPEDKSNVYQTHLRRCGICKRKLEEHSSDLAMAMFEETAEKLGLSMGEFAEQFMNEIRRNPELLDRLKRKQ